MQAVDESWDATLKSLLEGCANRDAEALDRLFDLTSPVVYTYLRWHHTTVAQAEEATVRCYVDLWRRTDNGP